VLDFLMLAAGITALYFGAEWLVRGSACIASAMGIRPLVIGLVIVGFGTSTPELVVSALASFEGQPEMALGNVVGSNIANSGLILALAALIRPMKTDLGLLRREAPIMIAVTAMAWAVAWTGTYQRWHGALFLAGLGGFLWLSLRWARKEPPAIEAEFEKFEKEEHLLARRVLARQFALVIAGLALLIIGGHLLVTSGVSLARRFGLPEIVIAVTLVSVGTSLPELATSIIAGLRGESDIAIGNVIGSNIFNLLGVLGLSALVRPIAVAPGVITTEFPWVFGCAVITYLVLGWQQRVTRPEGAGLLLLYAVFLWTLLR
jgi:cation:H+ antiporter